MRFIIYKNSILATICSMFGASMIATAVMSLVNGEIEFLVSILLVAAGIGLMWLADIISERKEKKKRAKAAKVTGTSSPKPRTKAVPAVGTHESSVYKGALLAGICFLLAALLTLWATQLHRLYGYNDLMNSENAMLIGMGILLMIATFRTRQIRTVSVLFVVGFVGLTWGSIDVAMCRIRDYSYVVDTSDKSFYLELIATQLCRAAGYFLMTVFALCSMEKGKARFGGIVKSLWPVPIVLLLFAWAKDFGDNRMLNILEVARIHGFGFPPPREVPEVIAQFLAVVPAIMTVIYFRRLCRLPNGVRVQSDSRRAASVPTVQAPPAQPEPRYVTPEPPRQTAQTKDADIQKKIQAYKDLLDCGILTQEEYDQNIRELTRG